MGSRFGTGTPKQFVKVFGKPILAYTLEKFQEHPEIDLLEIVCLKTYLKELQEIISKYDISKVKWVVSGGENFQYSVMNGISNLRSSISAEDIVVIHYGASPFVCSEIISDGIRVAKERGNSTSATPCFLLMGSNDDGKKSTKWADREKFMQLNSPQSFQFGYIDALYRRADEAGILDKVEPHTTSLMYYLGETIYFSKGNQTNIKITTSEDLELFEGYVLRQKLQ